MSAVMERRRRTLDLPRGRKPVTRTVSGRPVALIPSKWLVFDWIAAYHAEHGRGPLLREVGAAFGGSRQWACNVCGVIEAAGLIRRSGGQRGVQMQLVESQQGGSPC